MKLSELREILHKNKIRGYLHYDKKQLIVLLREKGLLPDEPPKAVKVKPSKPVKVKPPKPVKPKKEIDSKHEKLGTIRNNPNQVILKSVETGETITFPSIYKASHFLDQSPRIITFWNNRVWKNKYEIKVV